MTALANKANVTAIPSLTGYLNTVSILTSDSSSLIKLYKDATNTNTLDLDYSNLLIAIAALSTDFANAITLANTKANITAIPSLTNYYNSIINQTTDTAQLIKLIRNTAATSELNVDYTNLITALSNKLNISDLPTLTINYKCFHNRSEQNNN